MNINASLFFVMIFQFYEQKTRLYQDAVLVVISDSNTYLPDMNKIQF